MGQNSLKQTEKCRNLAGFLGNPNIGKLVTRQHSCQRIFQTILKPVFFIFGTEDNYGGKTIDEYIWNRVVPCSFNVEILETPAGNAAGCNYRENSFNTINSLDSYIKQQKTKGANLTVKYYDDAGHDIFDGKIRRFRMNTPSGSLYATLGAAGGAPDKLLIDILAFIKNQ